MKLLRAFGLACALTAFVLTAFACPRGNATEGVKACLNRDLSDYGITMIQTSPADVGIVNPAMAECVDKVDSVGLVDSTQAAVLPERASVRMAHLIPERRATIPRARSTG